MTMAWFTDAWKTTGSGKAYRFEQHRLDFTATLARKKVAIHCIGIICVNLIAARDTVRPTHAPMGFKPMTQSCFETAQHSVQKIQTPTANKRRVVQKQIAPESQPLWPCTPSAQSDTPGRKPSLVSRDQKTVCFMVKARWCNKQLGLSLCWLVEKKLFMVAYL